MGCSASQPPADEPPEQTFTLQQVAAHRTAESAWLAINGCVYDVTHFLASHPGGFLTIFGAAGTDASADFNATHSPYARNYLKAYCIGVLKAEEGERPAPAAAAAAAKPEAEATAVAAAAAAPAAAPAAPTASTSAPAALRPIESIDLALSERTAVTHNTYLLRFALPSPTHRMGLPCGSHVRVTSRAGGGSGGVVTRSYTPINSDDEGLGHLDLLVKVYPPGGSAAHPAGGVMSQRLGALAVGETLAFQGPVGSFEYLGRGAYTLSGRRGHATHLSMVAGGTGITPLYAVLSAVLRDDGDTTRVSLLFANSSEDDVLLRPQLEGLAARHPGRFALWHVLSCPPPPAHEPAWAQGTGRVTPALMRERLFPSGPGALALACGPPGLVQEVCLPGFREMGYAEDALVLF